MYFHYENHPENFIFQYDVVYCYLNETILIELNELCRRLSYSQYFWSYQSPKEKNFALIYLCFQ